jgi:hypothetical protein
MMAVAMREIPINLMPDVLATDSAERITVESLKGHFFKLELFSIDGDFVEPSLIGGVLQFGPDRISLDPEHARQLADRVRTAIDNSVAGSIIHRPVCRDGGH